MKRFGRRRGKRRSVSWIDGVTTYDEAAGVSNRLEALNNFPASNVWGASIGLVIASDLPKHGGEDAVVTRIRGRIFACEGRRNAGAGLAAFGFQMRVVIAQTDFLPSGTVTPWVFTSSVGLGNDDILWFGDLVVSPTAIGAAGAGYENMVGNAEHWLDIDVMAKRKVQEDRLLVLWFQTCLPAGTTGADFRWLGGLRTLLMNPV